MSGCFGNTVAISGNLIVVGDPCEIAAGLGSVGAAYVLRRYATGWIVTQRIASPTPAGNGGFGTSVAISKTMVAIGAPAEGVSGQVHEYGWSNDQLVFLATAGPTQADAGAAYGTSVAAYYGGPFGQFIVGAPLGSCPGSTTSGFVLPTGGFGLYLCNPEESGPRYFGTRVVTNPSVGQMLVGAPDAPHSLDARHGIAYLRTMGVLGDPSVPVATFLPTDPDTRREFGIAMALGDTTAVFGAPGVEPGEAWVYEGVGAVWTASILYDPDHGSSFGSSVALSGESLWVGSPFGLNGGRIYAYSKSPEGWIPSGDTGSTPDDSAAGLGSSLSVDAATWVAGAPFATAADLTFTGAVYVSADDLLFAGDFDR